MKNYIVFPLFLFCFVYSVCGQTISSYSTNYPSLTTDGRFNTSSSNSFASSFTLIRPISGSGYANVDATVTVIYKEINQPELVLSTPLPITTADFGAGPSYSGVIGAVVPANLKNGYVVLKLEYHDFSTSVDHIRYSNTAFYMYHPSGGNQVLPYGSTFPTSVGGGWKAYIDLPRLTDTWHLVKGSVAGHPDLTSGGATLSSTGTSTVDINGTTYSGTLEIDDLNFIFSLKSGSTTVFSFELYSLDEYSIYGKEIVGPSPGRFIEFRNYPFRFFPNQYGYGQLGTGSLYHIGDPYNYEIISHFDPSGNQISSVTIPTSNDPYWDKFSNIKLTRMVAYEHQRWNPTRYYALSFAYDDVNDIDFYVLDYGKHNQEILKISEISFALYLVDHIIEFPDGYSQVRSRVYEGAY